MNTLWKAACIGVMAAVLSACATTVRERIVVQEAPAQHMVVRHPPAPIAEVIPAAPSSGANWVSGHWVWRDAKWEWVTGHWYGGHVRPIPPVIVEQITVAPAPHAYWVPGHWKFERGDWVWIKGRYYY
jgi:hypothetical protein